MQAVPAAGGPARHDADDDLGHEPDQPVHLHNVQAAAASGVNRLGRLTGGVLVAVAAADALVTTGAEGPAAVLRRRPVTGQQHTAHVAGHPRVIERPVQFIHRVRPERVADLGPVERHADGAAVHGAVVGDVGERKPRYLAPQPGFEDLRDHAPILVDRSHDFLNRHGHDQGEHLHLGRAAAEVRSGRGGRDWLRHGAVRSQAGPHPHRSQGQRARRSGAHRRLAGPARDQFGDLRRLSRRAHGRQHGQGRRLRPSSRARGTDSSPWAAGRPSIPPRR